MENVPMNDKDSDPYDAHDGEKSDDDPKAKTRLDKPATGEEATAVDEQGPKGAGIRGPEGHAKDYE